jgi:hypothetical protein
MARPLFAIAILPAFIATKTAERLKRELRSVGGRLFDRRIPAIVNDIYVDRYGGCVGLELLRNKTLELSNL